VAEAVTTTTTTTTTAEAAVATMTSMVSAPGLSFVVHSCDAISVTTVPFGRSRSR
jgi:hypothetical protein